MNVRQKLEERVRRKEQEIRSHRSSIEKAEAYVQAMQDAIKLIPKDDTSEGGTTLTLRPGSSAHKAMEAIKAARRPLHITEILKAVGLKPEKKNKLAYGSTLARYARNHEIFKKTAPNTFDLFEGNQVFEEELPEGFGIEGEQGEEEEGLGNSFRPVKREHKLPIKRIPFGIHEP